jgi:putative membrane protein
VLEQLPLPFLALLLAGYGTGVLRLRGRGIAWPPGRTNCLLAGCACFAVAVLPPVGTSDDSFRIHAVQHLLLGMAGPALLALSAPLTLALRTLPGRPRRRLLRLLHGRSLRILTAPVTALALSVGGSYGLYLTGLYARAEANAVVHAAVHLHLVLAGCLLSWAVVGVDPVRRRPSTAVRMTVLVVAAAAHDTLTKIMFARGLPIGGGPIGERHTGAQLMYYGGTVVDIALAAVLLTQWWRASGRALARDQRRSRAPVLRATAREGSPP